MQGHTDNNAVLSQYDPVNVMKHGADGWNASWDTRIWWLHLCSLVFARFESERNRFHQSHGPPRSGTGQIPRLEMAPRHENGQNPVMHGLSSLAMTIVWEDTCVRLYCRLRSVLNFSEITAIPGLFGPYLAQLSGLGASLMFSVLILPNLEDSAAL